jgi:hypothetical protein
MTETVLSMKRVPSKIDGVSSVKGNGRIRPQGFPCDAGNRTMAIEEEKRTALRAPRLRNYRVEIKLVGQPIYQFKVTDVSPQGAGLLVHESSDFLKLIEVGQTLEVMFISPQGSQPNGAYKVEVRHITARDRSRYKGVRLVGVRILERLEDS